jgi:hypothetical protein
LPSAAPVSSFFAGLDLRFAAQQILPQRLRQALMVRPFLGRTPTRVCYDGSVSGLFGFFHA